MDSVQYRVHRMRSAYTAHKFRCSFGRSCQAGILWREYRNSLEGMYLNCERKKANWISIWSEMLWTWWRIWACCIVYLFCNYLHAKWEWELQWANQISVVVYFWVTTKVIWTDYLKVKNPVFCLFSFPCCCSCCCYCCCCCFVFVSLFVVDWLLLLLFVGVFAERINVGLLVEKNNNHASNRYNIPFAHSFRLLCISTLRMVDSPTKFYQTTERKRHQFLT